MACLRWINRRPFLLATVFALVFVFPLSSSMLVPMSMSSQQHPYVTIRRFQASDADAIARLFHETVRTVNLQNYTLSQVQAWAPGDLYFRDWVSVCQERFTLVAESTRTIAGFAELETHNGHIDCFYCSKDHQRKGVGKQLYKAIEQEARSLQLTQLCVEASITAKPFFEQMGSTVLQSQTVSTRGQSFVNNEMQKLLLVQP
jgi:putative acetyltransferase